MIIAAADNPRLRGGVTLDDLVDAPWVFTYQTRTAFTSASRQLQYLGIEPRVEVVIKDKLHRIAALRPGTRPAGTPPTGTARLHAGDRGSRRRPAALRRGAALERPVVASGALRRSRARMDAWDRRPGRSAAVDRRRRRAGSGRGPRVAGQLTVLARTTSSGSSRSDRCSCVEPPATSSRRSRRPAYPSRSPGWLTVEIGIGASTRPGCCRTRSRRPLREAAPRCAR